MASTARPSAPPIWAVVLTRPEASPASCGVALDMASVISAGKHRPAPVPISTVTGSTCTRNELPCAGARANRASPAAIRPRPGNSRVRAPNRITSRSVYRTDRTPMTTATGRNASPICSGS